jgi:molybdopterin converting factor small subunit
MIIKIVAFGVARDIIGGSQLDMECESNLIVSQAIELLKTQFPDFQKLASIKMAVNEDYVSNDFVISEGDELVLIPPVSGG